MQVKPQPIEGIFFRDFKNAHIPEILDEIYTKDVYAPYLIGKKDLTIVDIGANIGLFSYFAKNYAKKVYAVEPAPEHIETLTKMIEFNKIKNITVCPFAISNKTGKEKFFLNPNTTAHSLSINNDPKNFVLTDIFAFDDFMEKYQIDHIDLLKLDPEGEEAKILSSAGFIKYAPKVKAIFGEWHQWCNMEKAQFANLLRDLGYEFKWRYDTKAAVYSAVYMPKKEKEVKIIAPPSL